MQDNTTAIQVLEDRVESIISDLSYFLEQDAALTKQATKNRTNISALFTELTSLQQTVKVLKSRS